MKTILSAHGRHRSWWRRGSGCGRWLRPRRWVLEFGRFRTRPGGHECPPHMEWGAFLGLGRGWSPSFFGWIHRAEARCYRAEREDRMVEIESEWTAHDREMLASGGSARRFSTQVSAKVRREPGAPRHFEPWLGAKAPLFGSLNAALKRRSTVLGGGDERRCLKALGFGFGMPW